MMMEERQGSRVMEERQGSRMNLIEAESSHHDPQAGGVISGTQNGLESFETSKPTHTDILSPARPHLLVLSKQLPTEDSKGLWGPCHSNYHRATL